MKHYHLIVSGLGATQVSTLSPFIHVPAFQYLSSLLFSAKDDDREVYLYGIDATRQDIVFTVDGAPGYVVAAWEDLVEHLRPTIQSVCFKDSAIFTTIHLGCLWVQ